ncbi:hypothetical protein DP113_26435 [Brasilonema octagenarum UFV-E1]|uniref:Carrier domain-containing protein n=1 Tax=Brasilonema sennae CENA114 TaxID=415709 RepID=A0A856MJX7_9CYAN|nr:non-ribosomal peptide synthetase [Brasilonema sennae]QDL10988.1 hypothetical protein DP114_26510 [Brasilonema sennae CENA114]QDL17334.1 hypothetical protein DP113_26435 [Brasilonema octagenarum UFV-E1]
MNDISNKTAVLSTAKKELPDNITDKQIVEAAVLGYPLIDDCVVLVREGKTSKPELVTYLVAGGSFSLEKLQSHLQGVLPAAIIPKYYVKVSSLPLTDQGVVDEQALVNLEVIDSELIERWEEQVRSLPEVEQAAVVVQEDNEKIPPLHLLDVLPEWKVANDSTPHPTKIVPQASTQKSDSIAISHGEPLQLPTDAPENLSQVLLTAAIEASERGIVYIHPDGSETIQSYEALLEEAQRLLGGLRKLGLEPQDKVILQLDRYQDFILAFWGCILGGFVPVPITIASNYNDPSDSNVKKLQHACLVLNQPIVLTNGSIAPQIRTLSNQLNLENLQVETVEDLRSHEPDQNWHKSQPDDLALLLLTSGSTGMPKGVTLTHRNIISSVAGTSQINHLTSQDISLNWLPLDHPGPLIRCVIRCIFLGCQQIHAPTAIVLQDILKWLDLIERYRVTTTWAPNFAFALLSERAIEIEQGRWNLSSVKSFLNTAEPIVPQTAQRVRELLSPHGLRDNAMHSSWGMAETSSGVTSSEEYLLNTSIPQYASFAELGSPIPGISLRIVNDNQEVVNEQTIGYLQVKGSTVTSGYYQNPALNQEVFTEDGWFNTGDLGFLHNGRLTITGRTKNIIIINGVNYYSHEIEQVVEAVAGVEVSYTAACATRQLGSNTDELIVFFHTSISEDNRLGELLKEIRKKVVSKIGIRPAYLIPVEKEVIPKTSIGKIQHAQLKKSFEAGEFDSILKRVDILLENDKTLPDWFYRPIWRRKETVALDIKPQTGLVLVFLDSLGLGEVLCAELSKLNQSYVSVEAGTDFAKLADNRYRIAPENPDHYRQLLEFVSIATNKLPIEQILHLWTYDQYAGEISSLEALEEAQERGVYSLLFLVQALEQVQGSQTPVRLQVIASLSQATSNEEKIACERSPLPGLVKTISAELPSLDTRHLDLPVQNSEVNAAYILQELQVIQKEQEVAYRNGQRLVPYLEKVDLRQEEKQELPFKPRGMYLISGGLGGVGVEIAKYLLKQYNARLLLVGRTPLPERSTWETHLQQENAVSERIRAYLSLEQLEGEVIYEAVDICDLTKLQQVVEQRCASWQCELNGVIHLAGIPTRRLLLEEMPDSFAATLRPKVFGTWTLHQLIKNQPDSVFISFSSVNSFFGGFSAGAYAAANRFVDAFSHYQRQSSLHSYCFAWSMWDEVGMSRNYQMKDLTLARGYHAMTSEQGLQSLLTLLHHNQTQLLVGLDASKRPIRRYIKTESYRIQKLSAHFTASVPVAKLQELEVRDRFGTPSTCDFVQLEEMPLLATGEIDREQLLTTERRQGQASERVAPRNELERQIASIWQEVLSVSQVGIYDNFFELGGHSLLAMQVISRIRQACCAEIPLQLLFETPTIEGLAQAIAQNQNQDTDTRKHQTISQRDNQEPAPLSFAQQRLWFLEQLEPGKSAYHITKALQLQGDLNVAVLQQTLDAIVAHHEALRTNFIASDGNPVQVICQPRSVELVVIDLKDCPETERTTVVERLVQDEAQRPFNLTSDLMLRGSLLQLSPQENILLLVMHHIASDGWSMSILFEQLTTLYEAFLNAKPNPLPQLPIQYADFAVWQRQWLSGEVLEKQLNYWKQQLASATPVLELPTDKPRPPIQTYRGAKQSFVLPQSLGVQLHALSRQEGVTLFMTLLAAFQIQLYRYSRQEDIVVGSPIAGRNLAEIEDLIGFFANTLVLRTDLSGKPSFQELLQRVREIALSAYAHQDLPFEKLVEELQPERSLSYHPIFQVMFVFLNTPKQTLELPELSISSIEVDNFASQFDLTLSMKETEQGLQGLWEYSTDLFEDATITRMSGHFQTLLEAIVANPNGFISEFPLLTAPEQRLLLQWNNTQANYSKQSCIYQLFETQVEKTPDAVAIVFGREQLTYKQLNERANQLAHYLKQLGVKPDVLVGICVERSIEMVLGLLAILKAGGAYVPLDPAYPQERVDSILSDSQVSVLLTDTKKSLAVAVDTTVICLDTDWENIATHSVENPAPSATADNLAYVIYTSGSTGKPKGVQIPHGALVNFLTSMQCEPGLTQADVLLAVTTISFDIAALELYLPLITGARIVLATREVASDGSLLSELIADAGATLMQATPATWRMLLTAEWAGVPGLKILSGGEALSSDLARQLLATGAVVWNMYGPTETTIWSTLLEVKATQLSHATVPIGRPIANTQIYLLDSHMQPVPIGVSGELHIGGDGLARGYLNRPDLTDLKFIPNPFSQTKEARLYKTGDLARYLPDGKIEYIERIDNQVKVRGFRIELGEIEAVLSQHPAILQTVVIAYEAVPGDKRLVAYIVPNQDSVPITSELRLYLRERLPEYMVPFAYLLLEALPLTPNGKVNRRALPAPESVKQELEADFVAPRNELERQIAQIWEEILGIQPVGVTVNFFDLGGHSLLAVRLFAQIEKKFGKKLPLSTLFQSGTVEALAEMLHSEEEKPVGEQVLVTARGDDKSGTLWSSLVPIQPNGSKRPFFCIHPLGGEILCYRPLALHLGSDQPVYGIQPQGLDGKHTPLTRIEDMAAHYIKEIQTIQPNGPYYLGGYSLGGIIAYEMAQQLHSLGEKVRVLAMLDTSRPGTETRLPFVLRVFEHINNIIQEGPTYLQQKLVGWSEWGTYHLRDKYRRLLEKSEILPEGDEHLDVMAANVQAIEQYTFKPYPGQMAVFRTDDKNRDDAVGVKYDPQFGWGEVTGGVDVYHLPGSHLSFLDEPDVQVLAEQLKLCLEKAQAAELTN